MGAAAAVALGLGLALGVGAAALVARWTAPVQVDRADPALLEATQRAAAQARSPAALTPEAELALRAYLNLVATELGLLSEPARFFPAGVEAGVEQVALRWNLRGDPLDLPALLAAFDTQRHVILIDRVEVRAAPDQPRGASIRLRGALHRPWLPDRDHMLATLRTRSSAPPAHHRLLLAAAERYGWRRFSEAEAAGRAEARARSAALQRELPAALLRAREEGQTLRWAAGSGIVRAVESGADGDGPRSSTGSDGAVGRPR